MKKVLLSMILSLALVAVLVACDQTTTVATTLATTVTTEAPVAVEFKIDGEFTAYDLTVSSNKPQVTMVTVTIEDGEIVGYYIDCRQGSRTATTVAEVTTYAFAWNAMTKKELGFGYKMHYGAYSTWAAAQNPVETPSVEGYAAWMGSANSTQLEWFEQANLLEAYWLENGVDSLQVNADGDFTNIAGVSVSNAGYTSLAQRAVNLAREGRFQAFVCEGTDFYFATMVVNNLGEVSELTLDTLQSTRDTAAGTFVWRPYSKQVLGFNYKMHYSQYTTWAAAQNPVQTASQAGYVAWMNSAASTYLEWFEQADIITSYILANGWNADLKPIAADAGVSLDGINAIDGTAGVTVGTQTYFDVLGELFACPAEGEIA